MEIICCDTGKIVEALVEDSEYLKRIWSFLDSDELNSLNSMFFSRMMIEFLTKKPAKVRFLTL